MEMEQKRGETRGGRRAGEVGERYNVSGDKKEGGREGSGEHRERR